MTKKKERKKEGKKEKKRKEREKEKPMDWKSAHESSPGSQLIESSPGSTQHGKVL